MKYTVSDLTKIAVLIAISVVLSRFLSFRILIFGVEGIRIGFGNFPIILSGFLFGPMAGAICGMLSDILGYLLFPLGPYMPHFTLNSALIGAIPAIILGKRIREGIDIPIIYYVLSIGMEEIITTVLLLPYFLHILFKIPIPAILPAYIIRAIIDIILFSPLMKTLIKRISF